MSAIITLAVCTWGACRVNEAAPGWGVDDVFGIVEDKAVVFTAREQPLPPCTGQRQRLVRRAAPRSVYLLRVQLGADDRACGFDTICVHAVVAVTREVYDGLAIGDLWIGHRLVSSGVP